MVIILSIRAFHADQPDLMTHPQHRMSSFLTITASVNSLSTVTVAFVLRQDSTCSGKGAAQTTPVKSHDYIQIHITLSDRSYLEAL